MSSRKLSTILLYFTLLILLIAAAACAPVPDQQAADPSDSQAENATAADEAGEDGPVTIRLRTDQVADEELLQEAIAEFQTLHPNITVELEIVGYKDPADRIAQIRTLFAANAEPDIIYFWDQFFSNFVAEDIVYDLTDAMEANGGEWKNQFQPSLLENVSYNGRVYGVPATISMVQMYYNKDIFDQYGLEIPETWDELVQAAETLKANDVTPIIERVGNPGVVSEWWLGVSMVPLVPAEELCALRDGNASFDDPRLAQAWEKVIYMYENGFWQEGALGTQWAVGPELFQQGQAAMFVSGDWEINGLRENADFEFDIFPIPMRDSTDEPLGMIIAMNQYFVTKRSQHPEAAIEFLKFLSSKEIDSRLTIERQRVSTRVDAGGSYEDPLVLKFLDGLDYVFCRPQVLHPEIYDYLAANVVPILSGETTPAEAMAGAEEVRQRLLDEGAITR